MANLERIDIPTNQRATVFFDPLVKRPHQIVRVAEVPRISLNDVDFNRAVFVYIDMPDSLFTHGGIEDEHHGRMVLIQSGPHQGRVAIYMEFLGRQHRLLLISEIPGRCTVDTIVNMKSAHFLIKNNGGRWSRFEDLDSANTGAKDRALESTGWTPEIEDMVDVPDGPRAVNLQTGITVHAGWTGATGLFDPYAERNIHKDVTEAMEKLALAMSKHRMPFLSYDMKLKIERMQAQFATIAGKRESDGGIHDSNDDNDSSVIPDIPISAELRRVMDSRPDLDMGQDEWIESMNNELRLLDGVETIRPIQGDDSTSRGSNGE